jgi:HD-GYP domain-containing protein (c-di-GMP phosphodiesterase class II)
MSDTRTLLAKISALRQRLEQAQGLANEARSAAAALLDGQGLAGDSFERALAAGDEHDLAMDAVVQPVTSTVAGTARAPRSLTSRARRVLERGRELLGQLRHVAETLNPDDGSGPLATLYRDTVAMIDTALRTVALLPDSATAQMHLCRGLEVTLEDVAGRLRTLTAGCHRLRSEDDQVTRLAALLAAASEGQGIDTGHLYQLAAEVVAEAVECEPLRFPEGDAEEPAHFIACHSLTVARVVARVVSHDPELRNRAHEAVLAALVHDAGMLGVPAAVLARQEVLAAEDRRVIEAHAAMGAQLVAGLFPDAPWLAEAVATHHERLDGTGYPGGLKGMRVRALARLLAVCDVYAAMCCPRPHRPARSTRTAMADTLLLAEQGQLDHHYAECLLSLSFYPVGSVVEMEDGGLGVVVATPGAGHDLNSPARPVVALLTDAQGEERSRPHHLDLTQSDQHSIVRSLSTAERAQALARRFPQWT